MKYYITPVTQEVASSSLVNPAPKSRKSIRFAGFFIPPSRTTKAVKFPSRLYSDIGINFVAPLLRPEEVQAADVHIFAWSFESTGVP